MKTLIIALTSLFAATSLTAQDDRELTTPTGWSWYYGQTAAQIDNRVAQGNRLVDIEVQQTSPLRCGWMWVTNKPILLMPQMRPTKRLRVKGWKDRV